VTEYISGIPVNCPKCGSSGVPKVTRYVWFVNQYGAKIRVFCHLCGQVTDKKILKGEITEYLHTMRAAVWKEFQHEKEFPF